MQDRCRKIRLLLLDVDGVLTDGRVIFDSRGVESKFFDVKDGHGLKLLLRSGVDLGIISGRDSECTLVRARELGIETVFQGVKDKRVPFREILTQRGLGEEEVGYVGDDLVDLPILCRVGFAATVADAPDEVKAQVHYVATRPGGRGAVREICELILRQSGRWAEVTARYFDGTG